MKFEINITPEIINEVVNQASAMHNVALHNLGNSIVRNGSVERNKEIANATKIIYDIVSVVTESMIAEERGENPKDYDYGDVCCRYISK